MYKILNKLKKKKKFVKLGVSIYNTKELEFVINNFNIDIINLPISVANQQFCEKKYLSILKKKKIEIHVRSIFLQGLLLSNYRSLPKKFKENKFFIQWFNWLKVNKYNSLDVCIGFIKNIKYIDKMIIGVDNLNQLKMIVKSYKKNLNYNLIKFNQSSILRKPSLW